MFGVSLPLIITYTRVLHGPGLGPWAGSSFSGILRAGPGAGLKLAGQGRARAVK